MKMKCEVIRDLFPSYIDGLTSRESNEMIEEHLEECAACTEILDEMKQELAPAHTEIKNRQDIKPFRKVKKNMRKNVAVAVLVSVLVMAAGFAGALVYYNQTWEASSEAVKVSVEAEGKVVTIRLTAKDKNHKLVLDKDEGNAETAVVKEQRVNPFTKSYQKSAYMGFTVIDENTVMNTDGTGRTLEEDQVLTLQFKDKTETLSMKELAEKAMENPVAKAEDVEMKIQKSSDGVVTLGFYPVLLGTSIKVEETGEDKIRIRMYYDGEGETEDNGGFYSYRFKDENTLLREDGTETALQGDEALEIEYQDKTEKVLLKELVEK